MLEGDYSDLLKISTRTLQDVVGMNRFGVDILIILRLDDNRRDEIFRNYAIKH